MLAGLVLLPLPVVAQSAYPSRTLTIVVGLAAGSTVDAVARVLADRLQTKWGRPVVIDNVVGSNAVLPGARLANSAPDGYTIGAFTNTLQTVLPYMGGRQAFDPLRDIVPVLRLGFFPSLLIVNADLPAKSFAEFVALAKASPGKLNYGSAGFGSWQHLAAELLKTEAGIDLTHVPYRAAAQAAQAVATGDIAAFWTPIAVAQPLMDAGKVRPLAIGEEERAQALPDVPTVNELGLSTFGYSVWMALYAPAGVLADTREFLRREIAEVLEDATTRARITGPGGLVVRLAWGDELETITAQEGHAMAALVSRLGLSLR